MCFLKSRAECFSDGFWHSVHEWWRTSSCSFKRHHAKLPPLPRDAVVAAELCGCSSTLGLPLPILDRFSVKSDLEKGWRKWVGSGTWRSPRILLPAAKSWSFSSSSSSSFCPTRWADSCWVPGLDESGWWSWPVHHFCKSWRFSYSTLCSAGSTGVALRELNETTFSAFLGASSEIFSTEAQVTGVG